MTIPTKTRELTISFFNFRLGSAVGTKSDFEQMSHTKSQPNYALKAVEISTQRGFED